MPVPPCLHSHALQLVARACLWSLAACLLHLAPAAAQPPENAPPPDSHQAVLRTTAGILGYTRWPEETPELHLCLVGETQYGDILLQAHGQRLGSQRTLHVQRVSAQDTATLQTCASLYVGQMADDAWRGMLQKLSGHPLLTIGEHEDLCRLGAMFCLKTASAPPGGAAFEVNLDSVSRSGLRVNPRVLQLARDKP